MWIQLCFFLHAGAFGSDHAWAQEQALVGNQRSSVSSHSPAPWRWRMMLRQTRNDAYFTAMAVDPRNPARIFVGTALGTLLVSEDGGVVWDEVPVLQYVNMSRTKPTPDAGIRYDPKQGWTGTNPPEFYWNMNRAPFMVVGVDREIRPMLPYDVASELWYTVRPDVQHRNLPLTASRITAQNYLLGEQANQPLPSGFPVRAIAVCPGATYSVLVATQRTLLGSMDGGHTFVPLFAMAGKNDFTWTACSPSNPNEQAVTGEMGFFRSRDGGLTWDENVLFWPGRRAYTVNYGPGVGGDEYVYALSSDRLYLSRVSEWDNMEWKWPKYDQVADTPTPWATMRWIGITKDADLWIATDEGPRISRDGGENFLVAHSGSRFEREKIRQVIPGEDLAGQEMLALVTEQRVYGTDPEGKTHWGFFEGESRKKILQVVTVPGSDKRTPFWWTLTEGELWASGNPDVHYGMQREENLAIKDWADARLVQSPSLNTIIGYSLQKNGLSMKELNTLQNATFLGNWLPRVDFQFEFVGKQRANKVQRRVTGNVDQTNLSGQNHVFGLIQFHFRLDELLTYPSEQSTFLGQRRNLHSVHRQIRDEVEDAWFERQTHLRAIAGGRVDSFQAEVLKTRVEVLETVMQTWARRPLFGLD